MLSISKKQYSAKKRVDNQMLLTRSIFAVIKSKDLRARRSLPSTKNKQYKV